MGYRCPVCGDPQSDDVHLANHLAFTALVRGGDHEEWLDEHVGDWGQLDDEGLASVVVEFAEEAEFPQVFEDTTGDSPGERGQSPADSLENYSEREAVADEIPRTIDEETREILDEARELTRKRRGEDADDATDQ